MPPSASRPLNIYRGPVVMGLLYLVSALSTLALSGSTQGLTTIWTANAAIVVAIVHAGPSASGRYLVAGAIGSMLANLAAGDPLPEATGFTIANMAEVAIAVAMLARLCPNRTYFADLRQLARFSVVAVVSSLIGASLATVGSSSPGIDLAAFWVSWFSTDLLGMVVVVPPALVALAVWRGDPDVRVSARPSQVALMMIVVLLVNVPVFFQHGFPLLFLPLAALLMATYLLGQLGATAALAITAVTGSVGTMMGYGPIASIHDQIVSILFFQTYLVVIFASSLPLAGLLASQKSLLARSDTSDRFHRAIIDRSMAVIFETDAAGHWTFLSPSWIDMTGRTIEDSLGTHFLDLVHEDDRADLRNRLGPLMAGQVEEDRQELRYRDAAGAWRWVMVQSSPLRDTAGGFCGVFGTIVDVTDRVEAEAARAKADSLYRLLADHSSDVIFRVGADGLRRYASPSALIVLGHEPAELIGTQAMDAIHPDDRRGVWDVIQRLIAGEQTPFAIYRQLHRDGHYVWLEASFRLIRDPVTGAPEEIVSNVRDISRRHRAEVEAIEAARRVRESHRLLSMTESIAHVGHWRLDLASRTLFWSDEVYRIRGLALGSPIDVASALDGYHPDDRARIGAAADRAIATGEAYEMHGRIIRPDGEIRHIVTRGQAEQAPDGSVISLFGVFQDVTRQATTEAALREGEAHYRLLAENATDLIFRIDRDNCFAYVSPSIEALTGYTQAETLGMPVSGSIHAEDWPRVAATLDVLRGGRAVQGIVTYRRQRKDGRWQWLEANARMSRDPDPAGPGQIVGVARDISDRKHFEDELLEARDAAERAASEARLMADTDELTGLASRRLFMARLAGERATADAAATPLSVAVFDVDLFKQVNDRFGHATGDEVLREVAATAVRTVRSQDLVGRIGGEEFAILMPNASEEAAAAVGERLRIAIERCGERVGLPPVTVSIGIAAHRSGDDDSALLGAADTALYAAKAAGRNRLCTAKATVRA